MTETTILFGINAVLGTVPIVCAALVLRAMYKSGERRLALALGASCFLGIGLLLTFLAGLRRSNKLSIENILCVWTLAFAVGIGISVLRFFLIAQQLVRQTQQRSEMSMHLRGLGLSAHQVTPTYPVQNNVMNSEQLRDLIPMLQSPHPDSTSDAAPLYTVPDSDTQPNRWSQNTTWQLDSKPSENSPSRAESETLPPQSTSEMPASTQDSDPGKPAADDDDPMSMLRLWFWPFASPDQDQSDVREVSTTPDESLLTK